MISRRILVPLSVLLALVPATALLFSVQAQGTTQNDANSGGDAANTRDQARELAHNARYVGQLVRGPDENDWYRFQVDNIGDENGRPVAELLLHGLPTSSQFRLELWGPSDTQGDLGTGPSAVGGGSGAIRSLQWSVGEDGPWHIRVFTSGDSRHSGAYELTFLLRDEDDAGKAADAGSGSPDRHLNLGNLPVAGLVVHGEMSAGDDVDGFRFTVPAGADHSIFAGVHFSSGADFEVDLKSDIDTSFTAFQRSGDRFAVAFQPAGIGGAWIANVLNNDPDVPGDYVLTLRADPPAPDPGGPASTDAGGTLQTTHTLSPGMHRAHMDAPRDDRVDFYRLEGVKVGQIISLGVASHTGATDIDPRVQLEVRLRNPDGFQRGFARACGDAAGIVMSADRAGTWFAEVREVGDVQQACPGLGPRDSDYAISYELADQHDGDRTGDAPASAVTTAPTVPNTLLFGGSLDVVDMIDTYKLGDLPDGGQIRLVYSSPSLTEARLTIFYSNGAQAGTTTSEDSSSSQSGRGRFHHAIGPSGTYYLQVQQLNETDDGDPRNDDYEPMEGTYDLQVQLLPNTAPRPVSLDDPENPDDIPPGDDVQRDRVRLSWSTEVDLDFKRYEVHFSKQIGFEPSDATRWVNISDRADTRETVTGLNPGARYEFLIRTYDQTNLFSDSNRRAETTLSGAVENEAPTLTNGDVSPDEGDRATVFRFSVTYTDGDNDSAVRKQVFISGIPHNMEAQGNEYSKGVQYLFNTTLAPGRHSFFFEFTDGDESQRARDPLTGAYEGPVVTSEGNAPPTADAKATPDRGDAPLRVQFNVTASDPEGGELNYTWDFDNSDGIQADSFDQDPRHTYTNPGTYTATVFVTDDRGARSSDSVSIEVTGSANRPPTVSARAEPNDGLAPLDVQFFATASDPDGSVSGYSWDFDNANGIQQESTQANPRHTYDRAGSYAATVTVTDNGGGTATASATVIVRSGDNRPPSVTVTADPTQGEPPLEVAFHAAAADADGEDVSVAWDFDLSDGVQEDAVGPDANHTYETSGTYTAMAIARDTRGATATGTATIVVGTGEGGGGPPEGTSAVFIIANPDEGRAPLEVQFDLDLSYMDSTPTGFLWDFGDDTARSSEMKPNHTYEKPGSFHASVNVTDDEGRNHFASTIIRVLGSERRGIPGPEPIAVLLAAIVVVALLRRRPE